ncbi:MAG: hypothetical protein ABI652_05620 [Acidobacteriota bacterium]
MALLATWLVGPATNSSGVIPPIPPPPIAASAVRAAGIPAPAVLAASGDASAGAAADALQGIPEINEEVDRLRARLPPPTSYPAPSRDPFNFGPAPEPPHPGTPAPVALPTPVLPTLPRLIAIIESVVDTQVVRTAAISDGDDVRIVAAGETAGQFTVGSVSADWVSLTDTASGASFVLSLR